MSSRLARCLCVLIILYFPRLSAQSDNPYHLNGNAYQENCNCYTLTPDAFWQSGSVWNINKISLNEPFDFKFSIYLGCHDGDGADGLAFVLQPISTSIGTSGGGIGYDGVNPSIGILVDTWQNYENNDPVQDHIAIHKNGVISHSPLTDVASPVPALASGANIEDCQWHTLRIIWDPATQLLKTEMDGIERVQATIDLVNEIFHGDDRVFWGFTAATGAAKNHQRVCTSLDAKFIFPEGQETCFPTPVQFIDSSTSFGTIEKWFWDFGDGTTSEASSPGIHQYDEPGEYEVSLQILGNNGCLSEPFIKKVVMGTAPVPAYTYSPIPVCDGYPVEFMDSSYVQFGTINQWRWRIGPDEYTSQHPPPQEITGTQMIELSVKTQEGCESPPARGSVTSNPVPVVDFNVADVCVSQPSEFLGTNRGQTAVSRWFWNFGDGASRNSLNRNISYAFRKGGVYDVQLTGYSAEGCPSTPVIKSVNVYETNASAGTDTVIAEGQSLNLQGSGGQYYNWWPAEGLSNSEVADPIATPLRNTSYVLTTYTEAGCATSDTVNIKVYKGPSFYVPSAFSPNNDGHNDQFRFVAPGMRVIDLFQVYNRYGQVVYSSADHLKGWDGKLNGINQPSGTYVWMISGTDYNGIKHYKKGTVTLVR